MQILGGLFFCNGHYASHNNHFMDVEWWKKRKYKIVIYFVNIPWTSKGLIFFF